MADSALDLRDVLSPQHMEAELTEDGIILAGYNITKTALKLVPVNRPLRRSIVREMVYNDKIARSMLSVSVKAASIFEIGVKQAFREDGAK